MTAVWTQPRTWSVGELTTAALMNQHLRDNLDWLKTPVESGKITFATTFTTTSAAYVDVTGLVTPTMTTRGGGLDVILRLTCFNSGVQTYWFQLLVDGVVDCVLGSLSTAAANQIGDATFLAHVTGLTAGAHIFKIQAKTSGNTLSVYGTTSTNGDPLFYVVERGS